VSTPPSSSQPPSSPTPGRARRPEQLDATSLELALDTLQQRITALQQSLTQQNKLATLGMVTAVIAHEFNNILTPMISYTKFALSDKADDALREKALTKAMTGAERLANISQSLLGFARGDESSSADVLAAVKETLVCLSRDLSKDGIALTLEIPEGLRVAMNGGHLQQVLMNLIVNARSAMLGTHAGGLGGGGRAAGIKRLTVRATRITGGKIAAITVADTGPGIPPDVLPRIFDPFFSTKRAGEPPEDANAPASDTLPRGGTGLGLTICHELLASAGGKIRAVSEAGKGATFLIELPIA